MDFCIACAQKTSQGKFNFHIQTNKKFEVNVMEESPVKITTAGAEWLKPLLATQMYVGEVTIGDNVPEGYIDLDTFRKLNKNFGSGDLRELYYSCANDHLVRDFATPKMFAPVDEALKDKIAICLTNRYVPAEIDFKQLAPFAKHLMFIGLDHEHKRFCERFFEIPQFKVETALHLASVLKGARMFVSNLNGNFAIAEELKSRRILLWPDTMKIEVGRYAGRIMIGPQNVLPIGGEYYETCHTTNKLVKLLEDICPV